MQCLYYLFSHPNDSFPFQRNDKREYSSCWKNEKMQEGESCGYIYDVINVWLGRIVYSVVLLFHILPIYFCTVENLIHQQQFSTKYKSNFLKMI